METAAFCREISSWLDPFVLVQSAYRYANDNRSALAKTSLVLRSNVLDSGAEGSLNELVNQYLSGFSIPKETLLLLKAVAANIPDVSWEWLEQLRFSGKIELDPPVSYEAPWKPVLLIREADAVIDIVHQPLMMLVKSVSGLAQTWKKMVEIERYYFQKTVDDDLSKFKPSAFLQHSSNGQLGVYLESQVAKAYGIAHTEEAGMLNDKYGPYVDYRAVNMCIPQLPIDPNLVEISKSAARIQAANTLKPI